MALSDYFSRDKRDARALRKNILRAVDKHAQSADRWRALEILRDDGSSEAVLGLLKRFGLMYDKSIEDEQEKEWVFHTLVEMGDRILPEVRQYMRDADSLAWALKVLEGIVQGDPFRETLRALCEQNDNSYVRDPTRKNQLVHFMGDHRDPVLAQLIVPYLEDADEGVRFTAVEATLHQRAEEIGLAPLLKLLLTPTEESRRIKVRIVEGLAELGWSLTPSGQWSEVERVLPELLPGARLDNHKRIKAPAEARQ